MGYRSHLCLPETLTESLGLYLCLYIRHKITFERRNEYTEECSCEAVFLDHGSGLSAVVA